MLWRAEGPISGREASPFTFCTTRTTRTTREGREPLLPDRSGQTGQGPGLAPATKHRGISGARELALIWGLDWGMEGGGGGGRSPNANPAWGALVLY